MATAASKRPLRRRQAPRPAPRDEEEPATQRASRRSLGRGAFFLLLQKGRKTQPTLQGSSDALRPRADQTSMSSTFSQGQDLAPGQSGESSRQAGGTGREGAEQGLVRQGLVELRKWEFGFISIATESTKGLRSRVAFTFKDDCVTENRKRGR